jgi:DNA repair protein RadC
MRTKYPSEFKILRLRELVGGDDGDNPEKIETFWRASVPSAQWFDPEKECFCVVFLNTRYKITGFTLISIGTLDTILVHPREVFKPAIVAGAQAIVLCHNHPSGDPTPSVNDIAVTRDLIRAGQLLKINVLDHVIMGQTSPERLPGYCSLKECGYFNL